MKHGIFIYPNMSHVRVWKIIFQGTVLDSRLDFCHVQLGNDIIVNMDLSTVETGDIMGLDENPFVEARRAGMDCLASWLSEVPTVSQREEPASVVILLWNGCSELAANNTKWACKCEFQPVMVPEFWNTSIGLVSDW